VVKRRTNKRISTPGATGANTVAKTSRRRSPKLAPPAPAPVNGQGNSEVKS
jgi:hypothetical protein